MKKLLFFLSCLLCLRFISFSQNHYKPLVIAYYMGDAETIKKYPLEKLTHIIYSFTKLDGDKIGFVYPDQMQTLRQLVDLKKSFPNLKVLISLGGWGGCKPCSPSFAKHEIRESFATSVVKLLDDYHADGIDLDWEYPGIEGHPGHPWMKEDVNNFTELVKELRSHMGNRYELSFAAGGFTKALEESIDWAAVMPLVDRVNVMTYDLVNGYSKTTGHHTALHSSPLQVEATDHAVNYLLKVGVPSSKIIIGAAFYARIWKNVPSVNNGLFQTGEFKSMLEYKDFDKNLSSASGFAAFWDAASMAPYSYNESNKEFATYDNEKSIEAKSNYVVDKKLGGIMFWELMGDTFNKGLLDKISETFNKRK
jgi:chitinase